MACSMPTYDGAPARWGSGPARVAAERRLSRGRPRARLKHLQEGTNAWDVEYQKTVELLRRSRGLI